jgi:hypothetical protein
MVHFHTDMYYNLRPLQIRQYTNLFNYCNSSIEEKIKGLTNTSELT